ncbi:MAG: glycosyltransferase, partial [Acidobacteriota bacterium]|nr:glycosyltransferase [Acidobacteriota bacterium]
DAMPAFPPSVHGLLNQRVDARTAELLSIVALPGLARREPQYAGEIFDFCVKHQKLEAAHRILELPQLAEETRASLEQRLREAHSSLSPRRRQPGSRAGVFLTGPFWVHSSLARINRELGAVLAGADEIDAGFDQHGVADAPRNLLPHFEAISKGMERRLSRLDLTIRLHWPPNFDPPTCGKLISIVPWEFSAIPAAWVKPIIENVDELWVLSEFNRGAFARAGIPPERIQVIPPGIDENTFKQGGESWRPEGSRGFIFLFVGGAIPRKGVDVLWNAFQAAFSSADDVTLAIKEIGGESFYRGQSLTAQIRAMAASKPGGPHLIILSEEFDDAKLAALYRGSDIFVLPYRGEGFGLPLAEALACGTPVITTGLGPAREFCPPEASWFVPARVVHFETFQSTLGPSTEPLTWFEPDVRDLARIMRHVYERRLQNSTTTMQAPQKIRESLRWDRVTRIMLGRVLYLLGIEASCPPALLPGPKPSTVSSGINVI